MSNISCIDFLKAIAYVRKDINLPVSLNKIKDDQQQTDDFPGKSSCSPQF